MKNLLATALLLATTLVSFAQSAKYMEAMKKNISTLDSAQNLEDFQNAANNFERIAAAEKDQWLPYYYAGYALVMKGFFTKDKSEVDAICDKADENIAMAESLEQNNSEITTLKAMVLQARLSVDPSRGMTMGPKSSTLLQQATKQEPANNPRAYLQLAQTVYYTPSAFGGGKEPGMALLKKSLDAFETFKPASDLSPNWGKAYAMGLEEHWK